MLYPVGYHFDLRKDTSKPLAQYEPREYVPGTWINIWAIRRERFAEKFSVTNITINLLATA